eukprot:1181991-Prorocentrum_minimum.AAC.3
MSVGSVHTGMGSVHTYVLEHAELGRRAMAAAPCGPRPLLREQKSVPRAVQPHLPPPPEHKNL